VGIIELKKREFDKIGKLNIFPVQIGVFVGLLTAFLYLRYAVKSTEKIWILPTVATDGNIRIYIICVALFVMMSLVGTIIAKMAKADVLDEIHIGKWEWGFLIVAAICTVIFCRPLAHFNEIPLIGNLAAYLLVTVVLLFFVKISFDEKQTATGDLFAYGVVAVCAMIWLMTYGRTNTFYANSSGTMDDNIHNTSAYIDTIYNVYLDKPFLGDQTEQYGHYALFYKLPLMVMGCTTKTIAYLVGIVAALTYLAIMYAFCSVVKSNIFRILTGFAVMYVPIELMPSTYWQFSPHRLFFLAMTVAWIAYLGKKGVTTRRIVLSELLCVLALLWNWESGAVSVLMLACYFIEHIFFMEKHTAKDIVKNILVSISLIPVSIVGCWLAVALYNLKNGGGLLTVKRTFFMEGFDEYVDRLETPLEWSIESVWIYKLFAMMLIFGFGVMGVLFLRVLSEEIIQFIISASIAGLGIFTYSINRPAAGHRTMDIFIIVGMATLLYIVSQKIKSDVASGNVMISSIAGVAITMYICFTTFCFCFIFDGDANWPLRSYESKIFVFENGAYNYMHFQEFAKEVAQVVPANTYAVGSGTSAIYMELGWDRQAYSFSSRKELESIDENNIFINRKYESLIPTGYKVIDSFTYTYGDVEYAFDYMKKERLLMERRIDKDK